MRTRKTQNIRINMTCGSDFRLKKLYLFLHIFLTFSRENSRLDTSPPMMKSVWSHLKGHRAGNCTVKYRCNVCNGAHHVALCDASPKKDDKRDKTVEPDEESKQVPVNTNVHVTSSSGNLHAGTGSLVALQTARGVLRSERVAKVRVLLDAGSHRSFVTSKAASLVNPKGLRRELLGINTFGQKCTNAEHREVVELKLKPVNGNKVISLEAFVVPEICRIQNGHLEQARREYPHLKGIWFSDVSKYQGELEIL
jgi:hypothetical protein